VEKFVAAVQELLPPEPRNDNGHAPDEAAGEQSPI
jgi:hypothetical protein